ncbi:MAG: calcium-binding protein [Anaerolineae bacterium]|nr:calcium-binding protein [Anaerolineae bacterium]
MTFGTIGIGIFRTFRDLPHLCPVDADLARDLAVAPALLAQREDSFTQQRLAPLYGSQCGLSCARLQVMPTRSGYYSLDLAQLEPTAGDPAMLEAIGDWHYWVGRGYTF